MCQGVTYSADVKFSPLRFFVKVFLLGRFEERKSLMLIVEMLTVLTIALEMFSYTCICIMFIYLFANFFSVIFVLFHSVLFPSSSYCTV